MYLGRIVEVGPAEEVLHDPRHPYTRALLSVVPEIEQVTPIVLTGGNARPDANPSRLSFSIPGARCTPRRRIPVVWRVIPRCSRLRRRTQWRATSPPCPNASERVGSAQWTPGGQSTADQTEHGGLGWPVERWWRSWRL